MMEGLSIFFQSNVRSLVLASRVDNCFSAGADLKERALMNPRQLEAFVDGLRSTFTLLEAIEVPTIAALDGIALGGGLEVSLCCDIRIGGATCKVGLPETKLAILPAAGGSQRLARLIGQSRAKELIFTGRIINMDEAFSVGILTRQSPDALKAAQSMAEEIARNGPLAVKMAKTAIGIGFETNLQSGLKIEKLCYSKLLNTDDRLEGLKSFSEGRQPIYKGQ